MQIGSKLRSVVSGYGHWCPACEWLHIIHVQPKRWDGEQFVDTDGPRWQFDGNFEAPTFRPSVRITYNGADADQVRDGRRAPAACCHYVIVGGVIDFCSDSTHALAGQKVPLPDLPLHLLDDE